jgi:formate hydrogenlyase transcriptional activator
MPSISRIRGFSGCMMPTVATPGRESGSRHLLDIIDSIPSLIHTGRPDGYLDYFNRQWLEYFGLPLEDLLGWKWTVVVHPDDVEGIVNRWRLSLASGEPFLYEARVRRADGNYRWMLHRKVAARDEAGDISKWYGSSIDIEERKLAEDEIREREAELRQILDLTPQHHAVLGPLGGPPLYANRVALEYFGIDIDRWRNRDSRFEFVHPDDRETFLNERDKGVLEGVPHEFEARLLRQDGKFRWFLVRRNPLKDERGHITRWYSTATDIEDRKQAEERIRHENVALREEIDGTSMFEEIVGTSPALQCVLSHIAKVAPSDSTVLIAGETGTGKELIARAIHRRSNRAAGAFVSVNCAAIPRDLIPSELFGHEKGAFTGAIQRRLGRFELADGGTVFLDEVGELSLDTQVALLRVLQEREFERVGAGHPIHVNVRVIAATNRDLNAAVAKGTFRQDLFYRLNVFPIEVPPLRERKDDILMLVEYFVQRYSSKAGRSFRLIESKTMELLQSYDWPGNIRELQNVIERSVILSSGDVFSVDGSWLPNKSNASAPQVTASASSDGEIASRSERQIIEAALAETRGRVSGPLGAAAKLGIPPSTLDHRIKALKIDKTQFKFRQVSSTHQIHHNHHISES